MPNPKKKYPGLKGILIASLAVIILVVVSVVYSFAGIQDATSNLTNVEPALGLFVTLALLAILAVFVYCMVIILAIIWSIYGVILLLRHFWLQGQVKESSPDLEEKTTPDFVKAGRKT